MRGILFAVAKGTATERADLYKHEVEIYLRAVEIARGWSQSEIARRIGVTPSAVNKAFKKKHVLDYTKLLVLEEQSGIPLPDTLTAAAKAMAGPPRQASDRDVEAFLEKSPAMRRLVELGRQLSEEMDAGAREDLKREMERLISKVA